MLLRSGAVSDEHRDGVKKREAMEGGREGEERNTEGEACSEKYGEESGREKMDEEPHCECCLRMFIKPEK